MQINKIKLALGLVAGLSAAMPMIASAAADQEAAIANANNWAAPTWRLNEPRLQRFGTN